jgi:hypothetical protein
MRNRFIFLIALPLQLLAQTSRVPFVGCNSDGQVGPIAAPKGVDEKVQIDASAAKRLAYYKASSGSGALAPRGWHCFGTYGSGGSHLLVTPQPIRTAGTTGPAVQVDNIDGGTSGRFEVADVAAKVFPAQKAFVQSVIDGAGTGTEFKFGPYPTDKLIVQADRFVQYQTPPHSEGLGTMNHLQPNDDPIDGVAMLEGPTPDLVMLNVRLPRELRDLAPVIIHDLLLRQRRDPR